MKDKKRIAIFAEKLYGGGVEKILQIVCRNFDYNRYDLTLYASRVEKHPQGTYPEHLRIKYFFDSGNGFITRMKNKLRLFVYYHFSPSIYYRLFIREKYDVGIAFIEGYATRFLSGAPKRMKKIAWLHTDIENNHWTDVAYHGRDEEKACYQFYDKIVCVSSIIKKKAQEILGVENTIVLHNPIETTIIEELSKLSVKNDEGKVRIVSIGSLIPVKGYDRLIRVVRRLKDEHEPIELFILGEGHERKSLEDLIEENNLGDIISLLGFVDNPYPILRSTDIYVCSSYAEGFNTAITEALVLGRAIVSTEISGVREQLGEDGEYGIITENSEDGIFQGLKRMIENGNIEHYQQKAMIRGREFNLETQMQKIYNVIES